MAGKRPQYRLVIGKRNVGTLWNAESKNGMKYFSGYIDVSAMRSALRDATIKKRLVSVNKAGDKEEHDTCRIAMFNANSGSSSERDVL